MGHKSAHGAPGGGDSDCPGASGARGRWSAWTDRQPTASASGSGAGGTEGGVQAPTRAGASCAQVGEAEVQPRGRRSELISKLSEVTWDCGGGSAVEPRTGAARPLVAAVAASVRESWHAVHSARGTVRSAYWGVSGDRPRAPVQPRKGPLVSPQGTLQSDHTGRRHHQKTRGLLGLAVADAGALIVLIHGAPLTAYV